MKAAASESFGYNEDQIVSLRRYRHEVRFPVRRNADDGCEDRGRPYEVQVVSWYDNENSHTSQMVRTIKYFAEI